MTEEKFADHVEAALKPKTCKCGAQYTLFQRQDPETCRYDDMCGKCSIKAALSCLTCLSKIDWREAIKALRESLNEIKLEY